MPDKIPDTILARLRALGFIACSIIVFRPLSEAFLSIASSPFGLFVCSWSYCFFLNEEDANQMYGAGCGS